MNIIFLILLICLPTTVSSKVLFDVSGLGTVYKASDGDTFWINLDKREVFDFLFEKSGDRNHFNQKYKSVHVRVGNIDTKESNHFDKKRNSIEGKETSIYVKRLVENKRVYINCWDIGHYNRPICSVNVEGLGDVGVHLIENGLSDYITGFGKSPSMHKEYTSASKIGKRLN